MGWRFSVTLTEETGAIAIYTVSMDKDFILRVGAHYPPEKVVQKSFEFLLEKESKEQILQDFDISIISHYYPDFLPNLQQRMDY